MPFIAIDVPLQRGLILRQHLTHGEQFRLVFLYLYQHVRPLGARYRKCFFWQCMASWVFRPIVTAHSGLS